MVAVRLVVVFEISVSATEKSDAVDDCHLVTFPIFPLKVNVVLLVPEQTVALPDTVPPTLVGVTVIVPAAFIIPQPPVKGML